MNSAWKCILTGGLCIVAIAVGISALIGHAVWHDDGAMMVGMAALVLAVGFGYAHHKARAGLLVIVGTLLLSSVLTEAQPTNRAEPAFVVAETASTPSTNDIKKLGSGRYVRIIGLTPAKAILVAVALLLVTLLMIFLMSSNPNPPADPDPPPRR